MAAASQSAIMEECKGPATASQKPKKPRKKKNKKKAKNEDNKENDSDDVDHLINAAIEENKQIM